MKAYDNDILESQVLNDYITANHIQPVRLHLGCGGRRWKDFLNVDLYPDDGKEDTSRDGCIADVFADMRNLGLPDNTIQEIFTSHTLEHFTRWEAIDMLGDWLRMMKPGGKVIMETPDFVRCVFWLFHPLKRKRDLARTQFYGNQWNRIDFETHRYVWSAREIKRTLLEMGYSWVKVSHQTETHYPGRDMRIEAVK